MLTTNGTANSSWYYKCHHISTRIVSTAFHNCINREGKETSYFLCSLLFFKRTLLNGHAFCIWTKCSKQGEICLQYSLYSRIEQLTSIQVTNRNGHHNIILTTLIWQKKYAPQLLNFRYTFVFIYLYIFMPSHFSPKDEDLQYLYPYFLGSFFDLVNCKNTEKVVVCDTVDNCQCNIINTNRWSQE